MNQVTKGIWIFCLKTQELRMRTVGQDWIKKCQRLDGYWTEALVNVVRSRSLGYARLGANRNRLPFASASVLAMLDAYDSIWGIGESKGEKIGAEHLDGSNGQPGGKEVGRRTVPAPRLTLGDSYGRTGARSSILLPTKNAR